MLQAAEAKTIKESVSKLSSKEDYASVISILIESMNKTIGDIQKKQCPTLDESIAELKMAKAYQRSVKNLASAEKALIHKRGSKKIESKKKKH